MCAAKNIDEERFVLEAAAGLSRTELADRHDLTPDHITRILHGKRRAHLSEQIRNIDRERVFETLQRLLTLQDKALATLDEILDNRDSTAVRAAREVLTLAVPDVDDAQDPQAPDRIPYDLTRLSRPTLRAVLAELGGPPLDDDPPQDGEDAS